MRPGTIHVILVSLLTAYSTLAAPPTRPGGGDAISPLEIPDLMDNGFFGMQPPDAVRLYSGIVLDGSSTENGAILFDALEAPGEKSVGAGTGGDGGGKGSPPRGVPNRVSASEKGSVLVYPKVEVRWDETGAVLQDTFISLNNDYFQDVRILMFFVVEGCIASHRDITLTANEAAYWSAESGSPKQVGPFNEDVPAYPDPEGSTDLIARGFIVVIAVNELNQQIRWNHLYGRAMIFDYHYGAAWEYNAYGFKALDPYVNGELVGTPGSIQLDGNDYEPCYGTLLLDFFAANDLGNPVFPSAFGGFKVDTDLTLVIVNFDFRQGGWPETTKVQFWIWNENGWGRRAHFCMTCWDESLLSNLGGPFLVENLQTDKACARIEGISNVVCPNSTPQPLLGVAAFMLSLD